MTRHVIVGAGPVGNAVARELLGRGEQVRVITRRGTGIAGTEPIAADASDATRLGELTAGATAIYNCVNPPYHRWPQDWPPVANALLAAAESSGAVLATTSNLYVYGIVDGPMTEATPMAATGTKGRVRAQMWRAALALHETGHIRTFEARGSDYLGGNSLLTTLISPALRKGRAAYVPADLDAPHTWTNVRDVAALLVTGALDERAWGRAWHVPSAPACSVRELTAMAAIQLGAKSKLHSVPRPVVWTAGMVSAQLRELRETQHQFRRPFVLDSSAAQHTFGLKPVPLEQSVALDLEVGASS
ncbi:MAG: NAD-dependent epimerase/dehydratase family protein [Jatrophihabitantaceae bacterium]